MRIIESVFDVPGVWIMDDYGTMQNIEIGFAALHFWLLQTNWQYHC